MDKGHKNANFGSREQSMRSGEEGRHEVGKMVQPTARKGEGYGRGTMEAGKSRNKMSGY